MNVIKFRPKKNLSLAFCFIDNTYQYKSSWTVELIKNLSDYTISNIFTKGYDVFQSQSEDYALKNVANLGYRHALVFSTGTEFINGSNFFNEIEKLISTDYALYGHILDRDNAYYELHHQCYLINLDIYRKIGCPDIGKQELNFTHIQVNPNRSNENIHHNYTPLWIKAGNESKVYKHRLHGWNIVSTLLKNNHPIYAFTDRARSNKKHYYPENQTEFLKHISWAYDRYNYCATDFVHIRNTEYISLNEKFKQIITPASGDWFVSYIDNRSRSTVIYYDYNQKSLDYWKNNSPKIKNVEYKFVKINLLGNYNINDLIDNKEPNTLLNLSNIFCYEGTAMFSSLEYRLKKELEILNQIPKLWKVHFSVRSFQGFTDNFNDVRICDLKRPTWHIGADWND